jgi:6-pyruvoyl tetrahydropterin synthase
MSVDHAILWRWKYSKILRLRPLIFYLVRLRDTNVVVSTVTRFGLEFSFQERWTRRQAIMDFGDISKAFAPLHALLDHRFLNEVDGLDNPTSEHICIWIWDRLKPSLPKLSKVTVHETCTSGCVYEGQLEH